MLAGTTRLLNARRGATAIEYGLMAGLVSVAIMGGVAAVGTSANNTFCTVAQGLGVASSDCASSADSGSSGNSGSPGNSGSSGDSGGGGTQPSTFGSGIVSGITDMATCQAAGDVWVGTACQTSAGAAADAQTMCGIVQVLGSGQIQCSGTSATIGEPDVNQTNCEGFGGTFFVAGVNGSEPSCTLSGSGNTAYSIACLTMGWGVNPDGSCGQTGAGSGDGNGYYTWQWQYYSPYAFDGPQTDPTMGTTTNQYGTIMTLTNAGQ